MGVSYPTKGVGVGRDRGLLMFVLGAGQCSKRGGPMGGANAVGWVEDITGRCEGVVDAVRRRVDVRSWSRAWNV